MPDLPIRDPDAPSPEAVLREVFGFDSFRGQQLPVIEHVLAGRDALVLMPTGGGQIAVLSDPCADPCGRRRS